MLNDRVALLANFHSDLSEIDNLKAKYNTLKQDRKPKYGALIPRLSNRAIIETPLSGMVELRIEAGEDPSGNKRWPQVGVPGIVCELHLDGKSLTLTDQLPYLFRWNTQYQSDGTHHLEIVVLNTNTEEAWVAESFQIVISNRLRGSQDLRGSVRPSLALPKNIPLVAVGDARVTASAHPLMASATRIQAHGGAIALLLRDGGMALVDGRTRAGVAVRTGVASLTVPNTKSGSPRSQLLSGPDATARRILLTESQVYWSPAGANIIFVYDRSKRTVMQADFSLLAKQAGPPPIRHSNARVGHRLPNGQMEWIDVDPPSTWLRGFDRHPSGDLFINSLSGRLLWSPVSGDLKVLRQGNLEGSQAEADIVSPTGQLQVSLYSGRRSDRQLEIRSANEVIAQRRIDHGPSVFTLCASDETAVIAPHFGRRSFPWLIFRRNTGIEEIAPSNLPFAAIPGFSVAQLAIHRNNLWIIGTAGGRLIVHCDMSAGRAWAYLPWNKVSGDIESIEADASGLWVATVQSGVRRIIPGGSSNSSHGYDGWIRVPLGRTSTPAPVSPRDARLLQIARTWKGVPYSYGGSTRAGVDCSGFVGAVFQAMGIALPRTSAAMARFNGGRRVHDELRFGDLLIYPGHVAIYTGNGTTMETIGGGVGNSNIWSRSNVIVRRVL